MTWKVGKSFSKLFKQGKYTRMQLAWYSYDFEFTDRATEKMKRRRWKKKAVAERKRGGKDHSSERSRRLPFMQSALASHREEE